MINNDFGGIFGSIFGEMYNETPEEFIEILNSHWESGKIKEYYKVLYHRKRNYRVFRNGNGKHKVERSD